MPKHLQVRDQSQETELARANADGKGTGKRADNMAGNGIASACTEPGGSLKKKRKKGLRGPPTTTPPPPPPKGPLGGGGGGRPGPPMM